MGAPRHRKQGGSKASPRRTRSSAKRSPTRRGRSRTNGDIARRRPRILVLQLDSDRLRSDGLDLDLFVTAVSMFCAGQVDFVPTTSLRDLLGRLAHLAEDRAEFDVIVVIGHSNHECIRVARGTDGAVPWDAFSGYLKPFAPRRLMLVACKAGRWPPAVILFRKLLKLRRILASPVNVSASLGKLLVAMIPVLVEPVRPRDGVVTTIQAATVAVTGGQVRHWMRKDAKSPDGVLLDFVATLADPILRELPNTIRSILRRGR